jgi:hypothetical protein
MLTNYHGAKLYDVAKVLYESLPDLPVIIETEKKIRSRFASTVIVFVCRDLQLRLSSGLGHTLVDATASRRHDPKKK